jgi:Flp pilus assembly protein TadG
MKEVAARWARYFSRDERGSALFIVGGFLVLLLFVGMATDFGMFLHYRRAFQNACDSAVLAGAQDLKSGTAVTEATTYFQRDLTENTPSTLQGGATWIPANFTAQPQDANGNPTLINPVRLAASYHFTVPLFFLAYATPSIQVGVQCAAQRVPVTVTGLQPIGMKFDTWNTVWRQQNQTPCPDIPYPSTQAHPTWTGSTPTTPGLPNCVDTGLTVNLGGNVNQWGSGNTGTLTMFNTAACGTSNGARNYACVFANGTGSTPPSGGSPPPPYCANQLNATQTAGLTPWPACSIVSPKTGVQIGNGQAGSNATGISGGVATLCATPNPTYAAANPQSAPSKWVVVLPLLDPGAWNGTANGASQTIDIVGFAAFELDCPKMAYGANLNGNTPTIWGQFVSVIDAAPAGNPGGVDTGVETIILVQ